jgi:hypothetical protein
MANKEKVEVILDFEVNQGAAITELEQTKKAIIGLKKEQQQLQNAYKKGEIALEEYAKESVRVEGQLKRQQTTYNNVQKSVTGVKTQLDKLIDSNKAIAKSFDDTSKKLAENSDGWKGAVGNVQVFGTSVQDAGTKMTSFLNPATATVGAVAALGAMYAKSTTGAKDLSFAQDRLSAVTGKLVDDFGKLVGGQGGGGKGLLSTLLDKYLNIIKWVPIIKGIDIFTDDAASKYLDTLAKTSEQAAIAEENLRKLEVAQKNALGAAKVYEQEAEKSRRIRDDEAKSLDERLTATDRITALLNASGLVRVRVLEQEIAAIKDANLNWKQQDDILALIADKRREIADINEEVEGKKTENLTARKGLTKAGPQTIAAGAESEINVDLGASVDKAVYDNALNLLEDYADGQIRVMDEVAAAQVENDELRKKSAAERAAWEIAQDQAVLNSTSQLFGAVAQLAEEGSQTQKALALFQIGVDTAQAISALTKAANQNPLNGPTFGTAGIAQFISGLAQIIGNIAMAKQYITGFADGGFTGHGNRYEPAGVVHRGEVVWSQDDVNALGGPHVVDRMRPTYGRRKANLRGGYYVGGMVDTSAIDSEMATLNAIKKMPVPKVSWTEGREVGQRVEWAEKASSI